MLITAGSTRVPIDKVRFISNGFKGKTGRDIARFFDENGVQVTLLTSGEMWDGATAGSQCIRFETFEELSALMEAHIKNGSFDAVIHSAAVSDYAVTRVLDENFQPLASEGKISSEHPRLYLEIERTKKLVDQIRGPWAFTGKLVKFKLQVGISDGELLEIAEKSRVASGADMVVANCLEWAKEYAYIVSGTSAIRVSRKALRSQLYWRLTNA